MRASHLLGRGLLRLRRARPLLVVALALLCAGGPAAAANLIQNGGFEAGPEPGSMTPMPVGSTAIEHWVVSGNAIDYVSSAWLAVDGVRSVALNGTNPGAIAQSFATLMGAQYTVKFYLAGDAFSAPVIKNVRVSAAGQSQDYQFDSSHAWPWGMGWLETTFVFSANASTSTLQFSSLDAGDTGPAIDSVVVTGLSPVGIGDGPAAGFALAPPLPNPATGPAMIQYALPRDAMIRLTVHNVAGREVAVLFAGAQSAGTHAITWGGDAAPGIYFVHLTAPGVSLVRRAVRIP